MSSSAPSPPTPEIASTSVKDRIVEAFSDPKVVCAFVVVVCVLGWAIYTFILKKKPTEKPQEEKLLQSAPNDPDDDESVTKDEEPVVEDAD